VNLNFINDIEDARLYKKLLARLHEAYPPATVQHEADLTNLARLNWQSERLANLLETDLNQRLHSPMIRNIKDPNVRLLRATRRALSRREHIVLIKQNEANLRATNTLVTRIEKWHSSR
jgi:hypothetical protein